ncbi:DUF4326 domain-containing protein [Cyanobium sp. ATX 6A2]|uniref:DUF4326 domain-containing protein n=1 Tax=Cyanobium sp. ATX 6A2 TaxID=2823700 RepID=UPI0020CB861A|nr:DUF4326 domain-containing protein [Cyanobium sp. ATX 6A2]MCP9889080.1 DUF4326 domain-containing protein [Cyanobium sp. ATX 6A2]
MEITIGKAQRGRLSYALPGQAYVGRPSPLGNPFQLGRDGSRAEVITRYRRWLWARMQAPGSTERRELERLLGRAQAGRLELLCWCAWPQQLAPCRAAL